MVLSKKVEVHSICNIDANMAIKLAINLKWKKHSIVLRDFGDLEINILYILNLGLIYVYILNETEIYPCVNVKKKLYNSI